MSIELHPRTGEVLPVQEVDLRLWNFGEKTGVHPKDFGFRFRAGGEWHDVQARIRQKEGLIEHPKAENLSHPTYDEVQWKPLIW